MTSHHNKDFEKEMTENLHIRSTSQSIDSLLTSRRKTIDYQAVYQRNYVWNDDKATFFIESILLGVEIPPLILFIHNKNKKNLEVIDGRQRYQTIKRFKEGDLILKRNGLTKLKELNRKKYTDLIDGFEKYQRAFDNTTLRIIEFSSKNSNSDCEIQERMEDKITREIFRRYNTGITSLKKVEVENARHEGDNFTILMKRRIKENDNHWVDDFKLLFLKTKPENVSSDSLMNKLRDLIVLQHFPINIYASTSERTDFNQKLFDKYIESDESADSITEQQEEKLNRLIVKVELLKKLKQKIQIDEWLIYQCVFWALTVIETEEIQIESFFTDSIVNKLANEILFNISLFTSLEKSFSATTNERFKLIANFFTEETNVDFSDFLKMERKKISFESSESVFKEQRLARQEAETTTIEDLILKMVNNEYQLRPAYQRQEVINNKKASGIIESILLGIPLPTIFIYRRNDGVSEVVDGQQRLLSILGFIGEYKKSYYVNDATKTNMNSKKDNNFKLAKTLPILKVLNGKSFSSIDEKYQDKIFDFELSIVYINEDTNPDFDPIDLFIRLNDKSYDIKDPSFEMWNSYAPPKIIKGIKDLVSECKNWLYYIKDDRRMRLEELLLSFVYMDFESRTKKISIFEPMQIYQANGNPVMFRVENQKIDHWLDLVANNQEEVINSIDNVRVFIDKISYLIGSDLADDEKSKQFDLLISLKTRARNKRNFYILWLLIFDVGIEKIKQENEAFFKTIKTFISGNENINIGDNLTVKKALNMEIEKFWASCD